MVTPVLNGVDFVSRYVLCLQAQVCPHWEALIVDDGSNDGTLNLLKLLTQDDSRFRVFRNTSVKQIDGPYQARNHALSFARGDYVCFLDIDDFWHPDRLASLSRLIEDAPVRPVLLYSSYIRVDASKRLAFNRFSTWPVSPKLLIRFVNIVPMLTSCISSDLLRSLNLRFLPVHHEDYIFWRTVIDNVPASKILVDSKSFAYYTISPASLSGNRFRALNWLLICYKHFGYNLFQRMFALALRSLFELISVMRSRLARLFSGELCFNPSDIGLT